MLDPRSLIGSCQGVSGPFSSRFGGLAMGVRVRNGWKRSHRKRRKQTPTRARRGFGNAILGSCFVGAWSSDEQNWSVDKRAERHEAHLEGYDWVDAFIVAEANYFYLKKLESYFGVKILSSAQCLGGLSCCRIKRVMLTQYLLGNHDYQQ